MVRTAIVGLGRWGRALVNSVQDKTTEIRFVAAQTRTPAKGAEFCASKGLRLVNDFAAVLADPDIDAVVIATPHSHHEDQIKRAAAAGKHVFVEKPITLSHASAQSVLDAAAQSGVVLAVGFCRRFHPSIDEIRQRLRDGRLGSLVGMIGQHTLSVPTFAAVDNWRTDPAESPAGAMTAVGLHVLDHMIEFGGTVRSVYCLTGHRGGGPADDTTTVLLQFASGITGTIFCSIATATNFSFSVYGSRGAAEVSGPALARFRFVPVSHALPAGPGMAPPDETADHAGFDMLSAELIEFARCIRERRVFPVAAEDVLHGMAVFDAAVESAASGRIVKLANTL
ncbi:MAG: Gfo/Idh/MocA family protein [Casimicrobiaceae bacterium]